MRLEKTVDLGCRSVRVSEITVGELRNLLAGASGGFNVMQWLAGNEELPADLLSAFTDLTPEAIQELTFSELKQVIEAVKEVNSAFFFVLESLGTAAGLLQGMGPKAPDGAPEAN
jgi:hypothetical protein